MQSNAAKEAAKLKSVTINLKHSKEILAGKVTAYVENAFQDVTGQPAASNS